MLVVTVKLVFISQTFNGGITAIASMPNNQFAVSYGKPVIDVWNLVWNHQHNMTR